ncbi:ribosomal biogenesis protein LAS1L-like isoform X2 [Polyodon spathula]|uniref:ribosomal biogenesis protein LAS1L-like isoform X2 n=1 Tax=Polyodon spathula TaxID=7913 RepID=UPI001B7F6618|nr:ribosomal biogenesis protein LAS1L-like isoform X2 [Polyodon spathula]
MKRKTSSGKVGHVVAWINKAEWDQVLEYLYSKDCSVQKYALQRISAWRGRYGSSTPVAVESTADLVRCQVVDASGRGCTDELVLLYGMALVRFVNLITERKQKTISIPLRRLANEMNIPEWIVNLRHDITHGKLPSLKWCRKGCECVLKWLRQEYWSRQLGSSLVEQWDSSTEEDEEEEEEVTEPHKRFKHKEIYEKARELLVSYEKEQFQSYREQVHFHLLIIFILGPALLCCTFVGHMIVRRSNLRITYAYKDETHLPEHKVKILVQAEKPRERQRSQKAFTDLEVLAELQKENKAEKMMWPWSSSELEWIMMQIKDFAPENREALAEVLLDDGFLIPTAEQLESLQIHPSENSELSMPCVPGVFVQFWHPLLKLLHSQVFTQVLLEKLFAELQLCAETSAHRTQYITGWITDILTYNNRAGKSQKGLSRSQKETRSKCQLFANQVRLQWQKLLTLCLAAPCLASPYLLQQILTDMDKPLPLDTQQRLLHLCCIYTQPGEGAIPSMDTDQWEEEPVHTVESLQRRVRQELPPRARVPVPQPASPASRLNVGERVTVQEPSQDLHEQLSPEIIAERMAALKGSPWQICTDNVKWKDFPLGKVPGQSDDPSCLLLDSYSTMSVLEQPVDVERTALRCAAPRSR